MPGSTHLHASIRTVVTLFIFASVTASPTARAQVTQNVVARISGLVFGGQTGPAVTCASVTVRYSNGVGEQTVNATTDGAGSFTAAEFELPFDQLAEIEITVEAAGYGSETLSPDEITLCTTGDPCPCGTLEYCSSTLVELSPETAGKGAGPEVGAVSGFLRDSASGLELTGYPTQLIPITVNSRSKQATCQPDTNTATTGDDGQFKYDYVEPGRYLLRPVEISEFAGADREIVVVAGQLTDEDLTVTPKSEFSGSIAGLVSDQESNVTIGMARVIAEFNDLGVGFTTVASDGGAFIFLSVPAGTTRLESTHPCYCDGGGQVDVQTGEQVNQNVELSSRCNLCPKDLIECGSLGRYDTGSSTSDLIVFFATLTVLAGYRRVNRSRRSPSDP